MKTLKEINIWNIISIAFMLFFISNVQSQIVITANDIPSKVGTCIITQDDTLDGVEMDIGLAGENQVWNLNTPFTDVNRRQIIIEKNTDASEESFYEANICTKYSGRIGELLHTYWFDRIYGDMLLYQQINSQQYRIRGLTIDTPICEDGMTVETDIPIFEFPLKYQKTWDSETKVSMEMDTTLFGITFHLRADVNCNTTNEVDGFGTVKLPNYEFNCLRVKSYIHLNEAMFLDGNHFKTKTSRTICYYWLARKYGIVARAMSYHHELNDHFTKAKQVSRLLLFNPEITVFGATVTASAGDTISFPIMLTDATDLDISSIRLKINYNKEYLKILDLITDQTLTQDWELPVWEETDMGIAVSLQTKNEHLGSKGKIFEVKFVISEAIKNSENLKIGIDDVEVEPAGLKINTIDGNVKIKTKSDFRGYSQNSTAPNTQPVEIVNDYALFQNYPNPFNAGTKITFQIQESANIQLTIFDIRGRQIKNLMNSSLEKGFHSIFWNCHDDYNVPISSGIYYAELKINPGTDKTRNIIFVKKLICIK